MYMTTLTYDTPCFHAFIEAYDLNASYYTVTGRPTKNVKMVNVVLAQLANAFVKGYNAALINTKRLK